MSQRDVRMVICAPDPIGVPKYLTRVLTVTWHIIPYPTNDPTGGASARVTRFERLIVSPEPQIVGSLNELQNEGITSSDGRTKTYSVHHHCSATEQRVRYFGAQMGR